MDILSGSPWAQAPLELVTAPISAQAFRVCMAIQLHRRPGGRAPFPSLNRLAEMCRCSRPTVERAIRELKDVGILKCETRSRSDGGRTTNSYTLGLPSSMCTPHITGDGESLITDDVTEVEEVGSRPGFAQGAAPPRTSPAEQRRLNREARGKIWDALVTATGITPATRNEKRRFGQSVTLLLEAGATPLEVQARWKRWAKKHTADVVAASTERVLVEHWGELAGPGGRSAVVSPPCAACGVGGGRHTTDCSAVADSG